MSVEINKATIVRIYEALANGDSRLFGEASAPELIWEVTGHGSWSRRYEGLDVVRRDLFGPLFSRFATPYTARLINVIGEGDRVVAEVRGDVTTKAGERYDNQYCFVFRFRDGKIVEVIEYADTALGERVLGDYHAAVTELKK
jgi:ketosteroid isomerase-like protein